MTRPVDSTDPSSARAHELPAKPARDSICTMTELVLPTHVNALGTLFGGTVMSWVDVCGAMAAIRHARRAVVTAFVDELVFERPVRLSQAVRLEARVSATFHTSMEVEVLVTGEDLGSGATWPCVQARVTFVAIDEQGRPAAVPPLLIENDEDRRRQAQGEERRQRRLQSAHRR